MVSGELVEYLHNAMQEGAKPKALRSAVLRQGWTKEEFNAAVRFIKDHETPHIRHSWWATHWEVVLLFIFFVIVSIGLLLA